MGSDQKTSSENGRIYYFDNRIEERVESCFDLDHWASEFGVEALDDLVKNWLRRMWTTMILTSSPSAL